MFLLAFPQQLLFLFTALTSLGNWELCGTIKLCILLCLKMSKSQLHHSMHFQSIRLIRLPCMASNKFHLCGNSNLQILFPGHYKILLQASLLKLQLLGWSSPGLTWPISWPELLTLGSHVVYGLPTPQASFQVKVEFLPGSNGELKLS